MDSSLMEKKKYQEWGGGLPAGGLGKKGLTGKEERKQRTRRYPIRSGEEKQMLGGKGWKH